MFDESDLKNENDSSSANAFTEKALQGYIKC